MYKYKKVLIAAYDINKSKEALTKIQTILSKNDVNFETFLKFIGDFSIFKSLHK